MKKKKNYKLYAYYCFNSFKLKLYIIHVKLERVSCERFSDEITNCFEEIKIKISKTKHNLILSNFENYIFIEYYFKELLWKKIVELY